MTVSIGIDPYFVRIFGSANGTYAIYPSVNAGCKLVVGSAKSTHGMIHAGSGFTNVLLVIANFIAVIYAFAPVVTVAIEAIVLREHMILAGCKNDDIIVLGNIHTVCIQNLKNGNFLIGVARNETLTKNHGMSVNKSFPLVLGLIKVLYIEILVVRKDLIKHSNAEYGLCDFKCIGSLTQNRSHTNDYDGCRTGVYVIGVSCSIINTVCQENAVDNNRYGLKSSTCIVDAFYHIDNRILANGNRLNGEYFCDCTREVAAKNDGCTCSSGRCVVCKADTVISAEHCAISIENNLGFKGGSVVEELGSTQGKIAIGNCHGKNAKLNGKAFLALYVANFVITCILDIGSTLVEGVPLGGEELAVCCESIVDGSSNLIEMILAVINKVLNGGNVTCLNFGNNKLSGAVECTASGQFTVLNEHAVVGKDDALCNFQGRSHRNGKGVSACDNKVFGKLELTALVGIENGCAKVTGINNFANNVVFALSNRSTVANSLIPKIDVINVGIHLVRNLTRCHSLVADTRLTIDCCANVAGCRGAKTCIRGVAVNELTAVVVTYNTANVTRSARKRHVIGNTVLNRAVVDADNSAENTLGNGNAAVCHATTRNGCPLKHATRYQTEINGIFATVGIVGSIAIKGHFHTVGNRKIFDNRTVGKCTE